MIFQSYPIKKIVFYSPQKRNLNFFRQFLPIIFILCIIWSFFISSSAQAEVLGPGWHSVTAEPVSPSQASLYYQQKSEALAQLSSPTGEELELTTTSATTITPEITELARALQHDPKLIYEYVRNNIDYVPYFGSLKGATLTYLDGSGNDFDQASLTIALLRASGYTASYEYGTMTLTRDYLVWWLGTGTSWSVIWHVLAYGGIPIEIPNTSEAIITRVWVKANIDGTDYRFDPALKGYYETPKIDIGAALNYNRTDLINEVSNGAAITSDYVQNLNEAALSNKLAEYSSNLVSTIRSQYPNSTVEEIVSGRSIIETTLSEYQTSLPHPTTIEATWDNIPPEYTATVRIQHLGIDRTFYVPEIAGKRLTVTYAGTNHHPELRLDSELIASGTTTTLGVKYNLILTIDHPYSYNDGTFSDQAATYDMESGATYALVSAFAGIPSDKLITKRQRQLDIYRAQGLPETSEPIMGESLNIMGITYIKECALISKLIADMSDFIYIKHHEIGRMSQESSYYIDVKNAVSSHSHKFDSDVDDNPTWYTGGTFGSALEHGILEQTMGSEIPGVSTVKLLQIANANGNRVFYANSANFASIRPQLQNYSASLLNQFQSDFDTYLEAWVLLPQNAVIVLNQWSGLAYIKYTFNGTAHSTSWLIDGDLFGGYGTQPATVDPDVIEENSSWDISLDELNEIIQYLSSEPVDMATGAFIHDRNDLSLGGKVPAGLTFSRSYSTSSNQNDGPLGYGWTHKYDITLNQITHSELGLGCRQPVDAASLITALYVFHDLLVNQSDVLGWMTAVLSCKWGVDQLLENAISVHQGSKVTEYIKLADDTYAVPPGITTELIDNGDGTFRLQERFGTTVDFDVNGRITNLTDIDGNVLSFIYGGDNLATVTDAFGRSINLIYSGDRISSVSDSTGRSVSYNYDANGNLAGYIDAEGKLWSYGYDANHRMTSVTNPLGITTINNTYDDLGKVDSQTAPRQGGGSATYEFYFSGFRNIEKDPDGNETIYYYDKKGNLVKEKNALGYQMQKEYDGQNHLILYRDPRGNRTFHTYDGNHNLISTTNTKYKTTESTYDSQFRLTDITNPLGHTRHMEYDAEHHLTLTRDAVGNEFSSTYYPNGFRETNTDGRGVVTRFTFDAYGNPQSTQINSHPSVTYVYDTIGRVTSLTNQENAATHFEYDNRGLKTKITDPLNQDTILVYDDAGQLSSITDRNGDTITYAYTPTGKVGSITYPGPTVVSFSYDQRDNLVRMQDSLGTTIYTYDAANRLISIRDPHGFVVSYQYDEAGNLILLTYPGNKTVSYTYDELNRLQAVTNWLGRTATYTYDNANRITAFVNFNSTITAYDYDNASRLIGLRNLKSNATTISTYQFTLDANGNRIKIVENEPLFPAPADEVIEYTYNTEQNRLLTAGTTNFTWDNEGQLSNMDGTSFSFDGRHRLTGIMEPAATYQYKYDGANHRLEAMRDGVVTRYIYDAKGNLLAEANVSNQITRYYIYGPRLLAMVTPANAAYCYHYNAVGSTIAITDTNQALVNQYAYTPFGESSNQVEAFFQPFKFVGQHGVMAEANGLYYMRARYYNPVIGRFISEDPSGFEGGDVNLYSYVANNPVMYIDPEGKFLPWVYVGVAVVGALTPSAVSYVQLPQTQELMYSLGALAMGIGEEIAGISMVDIVNDVMDDIWYAGVDVCKYIRDNWDVSDDAGVISLYDDPYFVPDYYEWKSQYGDPTTIEDDIAFAAEYYGIKPSEYKP